jgi:hypothetical protein
VIQLGYIPADLEALVIEFKDYRWSGIPSLRAGFFWEFRYVVQCPTPSIARSNGARGNGFVWHSDMTIPLVEAYQLSTVAHGGEQLLSFETFL